MRPVDLAWSRPSMSASCWLTFEELGAYAGSRSSWWHNFAGSNDHWEFAAGMTFLPYLMLVGQVAYAVAEETEHQRLHEIRRVAPDHLKRGRVGTKRERENHLRALAAEFE